MKLFTRKNKDDSSYGERKELTIGIKSTVNNIEDIHSRIEQDDKNDENKNSRIEDDKNDDKNSRIEVDNREDDYIDPDDLDYSDYNDIVENIEDNGWSIKSSAGIYPISHLDSNIVATSPVIKDGQGKVLEIICDKDMIIAICGFLQTDVDEEDFYRTPNLYTEPHFITLRCVDSNNIEISPNILVSILKVKDGISERLYEEFYGDLSPTRKGEFKQKQERYYIAETIILQRGERIMFYVHHPDRDISKVEFLMMSDLFLKDKE